MAITLDGSNGILSPDFEPSSSTLPTNGLYLPSANTLGLATNGTGKAFLDSAGNLGLGVTPSAWYAGYKAIETGSGSLVYPASATTTQLWNNLYINTAGNVTYKATGIGGLYSIGGGGNAHVWYSAPSGTAGTTATLTQAMTLDASGNLGIGTTSPLTALTLGAGGIATYYRGDNARYGQIYANNNGLNIVSSANSDYLYLTAAGTASAVIFSTVNTERARIDSSGNLLVGTTSNPEGTRFWLSGPSGASTSVVQVGANGNGAFVFRNASNATQGSITVNSSSVTFNSTSDQRLKENIVDAPSALFSVNAIKVRSFNWKSDGSHVDYGYIAQELVDVAPEAVHVPADPEEMMGVDFGKLTPRLVKAIQELTARLEALEAK